MLTANFRLTEILPKPQRHKIRSGAINLNLTVAGMVLKVRLSGDNDRFCTLLTDTHGVINAYARGARSMKNKNSTATSMFVYGNYELYRGKDYYVIDESQYEQLFTGLTDDIIRLSVAQYLCQLAIEAVPSEQPAAEQLELMRAALYYLSENKRDPMMVKAAAEMRLMSIGGYMPDLVMCRECGAYEADTMYFMPRSGRIRCESCGAAVGEPSVALSRGAVTALRHSVYADAKKLFAFSLGEQSARQFAEAAEAFALERLGKSLTTLEFLRTLTQ